MTKRDDLAAELALDADNLYREEIFTDQHAGTLRRLTPVHSDGTTDPARRVLYVGQAQLLTPVGTVPLAFEIQANGLKEALAGFAAAAREAVDRTLEELQELRREAASSIVIPDLDPRGPGGPGGLPGGGKIQLR